MAFDPPQPLELALSADPHVGANASTDAGPSTGVDAVDILAIAQTKLENRKSTVQEAMSADPDMVCSQTFLQSFACFNTCLSVVFLSCTRTRAHVRAVNLNPTLTLGMGASERASTVSRVSEIQTPWRQALCFVGNDGEGGTRV